MARGRSAAPDRLIQPSLLEEEGESSYESDRSDRSEISLGTASSDEADSTHSSDDDFISDNTVSAGSEGEYQDTTDDDNDASDVMEDRGEEDSDPDGISDGELEELKDVVHSL
jgi:hypothetical protein